MVLAVRSLGGALGVECEELLDTLQPKLRQVALLKFEGFSNEEVAERLDKATRTVTRYLEMIRESWSR